MIIKSHQTQYQDLIGGKASALARLSEAEALIPDWFAVTDIVSEAEILAAADELNAELYAVRSSAMSEDGAEHSFAGQFDSYLYVSREDLLEKIASVMASGSSAHLETYLSSKSINAESNRVAVIVQKMILPRASGVAFSADPVTGDLEKTIISALWGTGSALVSGDADADTWAVVRGEIRETIIARKTTMHVAGSENPEGVKSVAVTDSEQDIPSLSEEQILQVANLVNRCADHFGCPQDIEWAIENEILYLLQSRPLTTLSRQPEPTQPLTVWDNSNIAESYSGITSPLTFSFAKRIYEHVYREFCLMLSVPKGRVKKHDAVFPEMLGHIHGHVYYNLNSWYTVLAMLPGFSVNRKFMEQMMGVKTPMPDEIIHSVVEKTKTNKIYDGLTLVRTMFGLVKNQIGLKKKIARFYQRLESALGSNKMALSEMPSEDLIKHYENLESKLLKRWDAPLVNDFFAMIYYGVLQSLCNKWLGDGSLQNTLLLDCGEIVSAEPPRRISEMAEIVRADKSLLALLENTDLESVEKSERLQKYPEFHDAFESYLEKFGDRCLEELKLESLSVRDNSDSLISSIAAMSKRKFPQVIAEEKQGDDEMLKGLSGVKRKVFNWVLKNSRDRVRDRENLRFERTRLFGRVRQIMVEMGKRLVENDQLVAHEDVFFLTIAEVTSGSSESYKTAVNERRAEQEDYRSKPAPPDRFHTVAAISEYEKFESVIPYVAPDGENISGIGACPGVVRGPVRVVLDPREATLKEGEILVAQQTDPGWVVLFPAAAGLLVERGSLLSHSAIVAREMNLPCVVSIADITKILNTGDIVEMDGKTGTVTLLNDEN